MNKKRIIIYSTLLLLVLFSVSFVSATYTIDGLKTRINTSGEQSNTLVIGNLDRWTFGGINANTNGEVFNITINFTSSAQTSNVSAVNITIPAGYRLIDLAAQMASNSMGLAVNGTDYNWTTMNSSNELTYRVVNTFGNFPFNNTAIAFLSLTFNLSTASGVEGVYDFNITAYGNKTGSSSVLYRMGIDGLPPRAGSLNVTEFNGANAKSTGFTTDTYVKNDSDMNITIIVTDYNIHKVYMIYNNSGGSINLSALGNGTFFVLNNSKTGYGPAPNLGGEFIKMTNKSQFNSSIHSASAPNYIFTTQISKGNFSSSGTPFRFAFVVVDEYNQSEQINNSGVAYMVVE